MNKKDKELLVQLRNNNKQDVDQLSQKTKLHVSKISNFLKDYDDLYIKRNTILLNYKVLGYYIHIGLIVKILKNKNKFRDFLIKNEHVNSSYIIDNNGFFIEALFPDIKTFEEFKSELKNFDCIDIQVLPFTDEIAHEKFFTR